MPSDAGATPPTRSRTARPGGRAPAPSPTSGPRAVDDPAWLVAALEESARQPRITTVDPSVGPEALHVELAARGPLDLVVDLTSDPAGARADRVRAVLLHLRPSGVLLVADAVGEALAEPLDAALRAALAPDQAALPLHDRFWGRAVDTVTVRHGHV